MNKSTKEIEQDLLYLLEIIRRDYSTMEYQSINYDILFLVIIRMKTPIDSVAEYIWNSIAKRNDDKSYDLTRYLREYFHDYESYRYRHVANDFDPSILEAIIHHLNNIDFSEYRDGKVLSSIFYNFYIAYVRFKFRGNRNDFITDELISRFIGDVINPSDGAKIIDPYAGTGSLLYNVVNSHQDIKLNIQFQEQNQDLYNLCEILMKMSGHIIESSACVNSIQLIESYFLREKYDLVISHIPSLNNINIGNKYWDEIHDFESQNIDIIIIKQVISQLGYKGKAFLIVPDRVLFKGGEYKGFRAKLVENGYLRSVIKFDTKRKELYGHSLIVINKELNSNIDGIQFINVTQKNYESSVQLFWNKKQSDYTRLVSYEEIRQRDYILMFSNYDSIFTEVELQRNNGLAFNIGEIAYLCKSTVKINDGRESKYPYIKVGNLTSSIKEKYLVIDETVKTVSTNKTNNILDKEAVIISLIGNNLKATIYSPERTKYKKVLLANNCVALIPKKDMIDTEYLYYQFFNPKVIKQIDGYKRGGVISRITYADLLNVVVLKPEYEKELTLNEYRIDSITDIENIRLEYQSLKSEYENKLVNAENQAINLLIHNTGKYFSQIGHGVSRIARFLEENDLLDKDIDSEIVEKINNNPLVLMGFKSKIKNTTVNEVLKLVNEEILTVGKIFEDTQKTINLNLKKDDFEACNLCDVIKFAVDLRKCHMDKLYEVKIDCDNINMNIHKQSFIDMISNLLDNAEVHGFSDLTKRYLVNIKVKETHKKVIIEYSNDGKKFKLSKEDFILSGRKSSDSKGTGQGGAFIYRVVLAHNGDFKIVNNLKETKFIFEFLKGEIND